ncbi:hypothetical protein HWV07_07185 [Natronomonas salina]|nr:hypothetical protein HWV07_07185 [Natronomonas salina]
MTRALGDAAQPTSSDESVSETVVTAVADAKGVDPLDLDPLYDSIDPDALDSLFGHAGAGSSIAKLSFEMADCEVLVRGSGEVVVTPTTGAGDRVERVASHE